MHVIAGELRNMKRPRRVPTLRTFKRPAGTTHLRTVQLNATAWLLETFEDPEPAIHVKVEQQKGHIVTSMLDYMLARINERIRNHAGPEARFAGFSEWGRPVIVRRRS